jgi:hypothetical protein
MYKSLLLFLGATVIFPLYAETNTTEAETKAAVQTAKKTDQNRTKRSKALTEQKIKEQMEREKKYAKEQKFYQGDAYDLKAHEVDPNSLPDVTAIEPDYDFDITDVYRDDI